MNRVKKIILALFAAALFQAPSAWAFEYDCMMEPYRIVEVKSAIDGPIEAIRFERSDLVKTGDTLVIFESDVERATVDLARAKADMNAELNSSKVSHRFTRRKLGRFDGLAEEGVVADQTRDEVETEEALAKLQVQQAKENRYLAKLELARADAILERHTIVSPIEGVVMDRTKTVGEYPDDRPILTLAQLDPLNIEVLLPASRFGSIEKGMKASVTPEAPLSGSYEAEVKIVDRIVDASSGTFGVRLELPNPDHKLPGGLRCTVSFPGVDSARTSDTGRQAGTVQFSDSRP